MNITPGYDPEKNKVTLEVQSNLLKKYFKNFLGFIKDSPNIPTGTEITKEGVDIAKISFPEPGGSKVSRLDSERMSIRIDASKLEVFYLAIQDFVNIALKKEFKSIEFLPLSGYPQHELLKDVETAIKSKRNFCLIESYEEYLRKEEQSKNGTNDFIYNEYKIEYGTSEYSDVVILIYQNKMEELNKIFKNKLKKTCWN